MTCRRYQSLCGYDAIILDVPVDAAGAQTLAEAAFMLCDVAGEELSFGQDARRPLDRGGALACIVPLHDNLHHQRQFLAKARWLLEADDDAAGTGPDAVVA